MSPIIFLVISLLLLLPRCNVAQCRQRTRAENTYTDLSRYGERKMKYTSCNKFVFRSLALRCSIETIQIYYGKCAVIRARSLARSPSTFRINWMGSIWMNIFCTFQTRRGTCCGCGQSCKTKVHTKIGNFLSTTGARVTQPLQLLPLPLRPVELLPGDFFLIKIKSENIVRFRHKILHFMAEWRRRWSLCAQQPALMAMPSSNFTNRKRITDSVFYWWKFFSAAEVMSWIRNIDAVRVWHERDRHSLRQMRELWTGDRQLCNLEWKRKCQAAPRRQHLWGASMISA